MREIQTAENKTLKLTNVVSRRIQPEEFNNMQIVLTQMHNFIKSNGACSASNCPPAPTLSPKSI